MAVDGVSSSGMSQIIADIRAKQQQLEADFDNIKKNLPEGATVVKLGTSGAAHSLEALAKQTGVTLPDLLNANPSLQGMKDAVSRRLPTGLPVVIPAAPKAGAFAPKNGAAPAATAAKANPPTGFDAAKGGRAPPPPPPPAAPAAAAPAAAPAPAAAAPPPTREEALAAAGRLKPLVYGNIKPADAQKVLQDLKTVNTALTTNGPNGRPIMDAGVDLLGKGLTPDQLKTVEAKANAAVKQGDEDNLRSDIKTEKDALAAGGRSLAQRIDDLKAGKLTPDEAKKLQSDIAAGVGKDLAYGTETKDEKNVGVSREVGISKDDLDKLVSTAGQRYAQTASKAIGEKLDNADLKGAFADFSKLQKALGATLDKTVATDLAKRFASAIGTEAEGRFLPVASEVPVQIPGDLKQAKADLDQLRKSGLPVDTLAPNEMKALDAKLAKLSLDDQIGQLQAGKLNYRDATALRDQIAKVGYGAAGISEPDVYKHLAQAGLQALKAGKMTKAEANAFIATYGQYIMHDAGDFGTGGFLGFGKTAPTPEELQALAAKLPS